MGATLLGWVVGLSEENCMQYQRAVVGVVVGAVVDAVVGVVVALVQQ